MQEKDIHYTLGTLLERSPDSHKYDFGHILIFGGSADMVGAPLLSAHAALRSGAGLVTIASVVADRLSGMLPEVMTKSLPGDSSAAITVLNELITERHVGVIIIGPGLAPDSTEVVRSLVEHSRLPIVLDGGGLAAFTDKLELLRAAAEHNPAIIITPHAGEYQKLSGEAIAKTAHNRERQAVGFAKANALTLVLKGHRTLISATNHAVHENTTGNPGLATAGSGDVLTGIIAGLCGQKLDTFSAAVCAVYLHGLSADMATKVLTQPGLIASDIITYLPVALRSLLSRSLVKGSTA